MVFREVGQRKLTQEDVAASAVKLYLPGEEISKPEVGFSVEDVGAIGTWQDGDIWDGKANIADVAKLYICIKQDQRLEDLNFIGDINHDGLLTIIDVARLYSHITGRKPL